MKKITRIQRISMLIIFFVMTGSISAQPPITPAVFSEYFAIQANGKINDGATRANLLNFFCTTVEGYTIESSEVTYKAEQSLFLQVLCKTAPQDSYLELKTWAEFGIYDTRYDPDFAAKCSSSRMQQCELDTVATRIVQSLFNEYFSFAQAYVYGRPQLEEVSMDKTIKDFVSKRLHGLNIGDSASDFPETKKTIKSSIKQANNLIQRDIQILDKEKIVTELGKDSSCDQQNEKNILICGLAGDVKSPGQSFADLLYNEYFFYRLRMHFYTQKLQVSKSFYRDKIKDNSIDQAKTESMIIAQRQLQHTQEAMQTATKYLREMYTSYPFHIGMIVYYEKLYSLRNQLITLVTPLYTLYDKLQNVQDAQ